ncbi:MAG: outer membrane beta-barrel protein [Capnocytophaga sp.]|nr:outer membrane beta-barrel protein [Capnocytophaga sp.]
MKRIIYLVFLCCLGLPNFIFGQEDADDGMIQTNTQTKQSREGFGKEYLEDQFYVGLTYDYLISKASRVVQHNLSRGIHVGFLRDMPMNDRRNKGIAIGLGYSYDLIYSNITAFSNNNVVEYNIATSLSDLNISKNYFQTHTLELPLEFRWRTSTTESHKFWRIYLGVKLGYVFGARNLFKRNEITAFFTNSDLKNQWHFKVFTAFGYNTLNFFVQYNLTPILKNAQTEDQTSLKSSLLQMGLMFYIL